MNPDQVQIEDSWRKVLSAEFEQTYFDQIGDTLRQVRAAGKTIYPPGSLIFNAFNLTPFDQVKVVILGQDPYHGPGEAMGLAFSVPRGIRVPPSLKRIYKELHQDLKVPIADHGDLTAWAQQGVLLLNASLTVEHKTPNSHKKIGWHRFTDAVISAVAARRPHVAFLLWGRFAQSKAPLIDASKHLILTSVHPSPLAGNSFFGNHHFSRANKFLAQHGQQVIDWSLV